MEKRKYPTKFFVTGFLLGVIIKRFYLFVPSIILIIIGSKIQICHYIGCIILLIDLIISFVWQIKIRNFILDDNDNPDIQRVQKAFEDDNDPSENLINIIEEIIEENDDIDDN